MKESQLEHLNHLNVKGYNAPINIDDLYRYRVANPLTFGYFIDKLELKLEEITQVLRGQSKWIKH